MTSTDENKPFCMPSAEAAVLIESLIKDGVAVRIRVFGHSMEPAIRSGDTVVVKPLGGRIFPGDVLLCRRGDGSGACFIHRAVWRHADGTWRTKGDALKSLDPPTALESILGRVESIEQSDKPSATVSLQSVRARCRAFVCAGLSLARAAWGRAMRL